MLKTQICVTRPQCVNIKLIPPGLDLSKLEPVSCRQPVKNLLQTLHQDTAFRRFMAFTLITFRLEGRGGQTYKAPNKIKRSVFPAKLSLTPPTMPSISYTLLLLLSSGKSENPIHHPLPTPLPNGRLNRNPFIPSALQNIFHRTWYT